MLSTGYWPVSRRLAFGEKYAASRPPHLAQRVGVTPAHISKLETGKGTPSLSLLRKLARALDVDIDMLVGHEE